jgi:hypothetical protein
MFNPPRRPQAQHADTPQDQGKCGTKLLMRSRKDPGKKRWQCTSQGQTQAFHGPRARKLMDELGKTGVTHLAKQRREHPEIQDLVDHGLVTMKTNPKHYNYEFEAKLTNAGRRWLREQATHTDQATAKKQLAMPAPTKGGKRGAPPQPPPPKLKMKAPAQAGLFKGGPVYRLGDLAPLVKADRDGIKPIMEADEGLEQPVRTSWELDGFRCDYRQTGHGIGTLTLFRPGMPLPFHVLCNGLHDARGRAPGIVADLAAGRTPEVGLYRRRRIARGTRGAQGGILIDRAGRRTFGGVPVSIPAR